MFNFGYINVVVFLIFMSLILIDGVVQLQRDAQRTMEKADDILARNMIKVSQLQFLSRVLYTHSAISCDMYAVHS